MNGIHDMGGRDGMGTIPVDEDEPLFHEQWEEDVFGMVIAMLGQRLFRVHDFRYASERMNPVHYLRAPYYDHWLSALETLLQEDDILSASEIKQRIRELQSGNAPDAVGSSFPVEAREGILHVIKNGVSARSEPDQSKFVPGDRVRVRNIHPEHHTRCPMYARRALGSVEDIRGAFPLPDQYIAEGVVSPETVYSVSFEASELWGKEHADTEFSVTLDLWERYLRKPSTDQTDSSRGEPL